ncbi:MULTISPECIES: NAD(P)-dependent oxidoreductase [unclassified Rhizobacter]|uniref:NAD-dependent epimerase/dehydratase family protein n=1 Tax=unclassified Rhizobacter TaxID=2640088 RepID=UPI0006F498B4|nr:MULTISPECIES: NAD(P)-dependent oxidoreductase [unclassified Rhizobacter]KQU73645.1 NAD-dependent dehydratase [Rhizobacter sp. Root29]KQW08911.1 NAD-dependent dehydratase [Rhizobacter sp. Root1238]KRB21588.1 NAD-dependent dehydratase [Rhizobacter sp. Root16D2]
MPNKIILPGGAGLVGQNLLPRLKAAGYTEIVVLDKHAANLAILGRIHPDVTTECVDLADPGHWQRHFEDATAVVMLQAQIGGTVLRDFVRNNVDATRNVLEAMNVHRVPRLVHVSSSVVESVANDFYTETKKQQEALVLRNGIDCPVLRPTLMFGWFDRKHLGWLSRFMARVPVFPIPGNGRYMRQPLYAGDFCKVIVACIEGRVTRGVHNISGREKIDYIDIIREIKRATRARTLIVKVPYALFHAALWTWGRFDPNPPFTTQQLRALVAKDEFELTDWPALFGVTATPFADAIAETFNDPTYGHVVLDF